MWANRRLIVAVKTLLSILLGAICWVIMTLKLRLEFAAFRPALITLLTPVPCIGSALGVLLALTLIRMVHEFQGYCRVVQDSRRALGA